MSEIIQAITELDNVKINQQNWSTFEGFEVKTNKRTIKVLISSNQNCCEIAGYLSSFEEPEDFIGASLFKIDVVDSALNKEEWDKEFKYGLDCGGAMFVNFETDKGTFQLTAYNIHNGYYSHSAFLLSDDTVLEKDSL